MIQFSNQYFSFHLTLFSQFSMMNQGVEVGYIQKNQTREISYSYKGNLALIVLIWRQSLLRGNLPLALSAGWLQMLLTALIGSRAHSPTIIHVLLPDQTAQETVYQFPGGLVPWASGIVFLASCSQQKEFTGITKGCFFFYFPPQNTIIGYWVVLHRVQAYVLTKAS